MAHPYHHATSSVRKWGGRVEDYQPLHDWFDEHKAHFADFRYRAMRHHSAGIFECERVFGTTISNSAGRVVPVRLIGEQHCQEDFNGRIPTLADWFRCLRPESWMSPNTRALMVESLGEDVYAPPTSSAALS